jgi:hypothetical protein
VITGFSARVSVEAPVDTESIEAIARSVLNTLGSKGGVTDEALVMLSRVRDTQSPLTTLRDWLTAAIKASQDGGDIDAAVLSQGLGDLATLSATGLRYKGQVLTVDRVGAWLSQFPVELQPIASRLVGELRRSYFVDEATYFLGIDEMARASGVAARSPVVFGKWQNLGDSGERIARDLKTAGRWTSIGELDLRTPRTRWPTFPAQDFTLVLADDIVGSGGTLSSLIADPSRGLIAALAAYPRCDVVILTLLAYEKGVRAALGSAQWPGPDRVRLLPWRLLRDSDRCFHHESTIVPDASTRAQLAEFFRKVAKAKMRRYRHHLGYDDTGALVALFDSVPNNTVPAIWYDQGPWHPLLPRSGRIHVD